MPLTKGASKKTISKNIKKLMTETPSKRRAKGIETIAKRTGMSLPQAERKQAVAIALNMAKKKK